MPDEICYSNVRSLVIREDPIKGAQIIFTALAKSATEGQKESLSD